MKYRSIVFFIAVLSGLIFAQEVKNNEVKVYGGLPEPLSKEAFNEYWSGEYFFGVSYRLKVSEYYFIGTLEFDNFVIDKGWGLDFQNYLVTVGAGRRIILGNKFFFFYELNLGIMFNRFVPKYTYFGEKVNEQGFVIVPKINLEYEVNSNLSVDIGLSYTHQFQSFGQGLAKNEKHTRFFNYGAGLILKF